MAASSSLKMRKSLGEKRKEISAAQSAEIVRLYGDFTENSKAKIMPNGAFGYLRITVERPLRLRWEVTADALTAFDADPKIAKLLTPDARAALRADLAAWDEESFTDRRTRRQAAEELATASRRKGDRDRKGIAGSARGPRS